MSGKKQRHCPAIGGPIKPAVCGAERNRVHACPADCAFNPFAPTVYTDLLDLESTLDEKCLKRLFGEDEEADPQFWRQYAAGRGDMLGSHGRIVQKLFLNRDPAGRTFCDRWEAHGFAGLKNDEINLLRLKRQIRFGVIEHLTSKADGQMRAIDLLRPDEGTHTYIDRSMSARACRFDLFVTWYYPLPHYRRFCGNGMTLPDLGEREPIDAVRAIVSHLGGPDDITSMGDWCAVHFQQLFSAITATSQARRAKQFSLIDARFGKGVYELRQPFSKCRDRFDKIGNTDFDNLSETEENEGFADARVWIDDDKNVASEMAGGDPVLGRVLMGQSNWRVEAMGEERFRKLRRQFESHMGERVKFVKERLDDLAAQLNERGSTDLDKDLVPPVLLEDVHGFTLGNSRVPRTDNPEAITARAFDQHTRSLLDRPLPLLSGKTPREAATDLLLRPILLRWAKQVINQHDHENLKTGEPRDIDWLPRELNLPELVQPRPPLNASPAGIEDDIDEPGPLDTRPRPAPPRLPKKPLDFRQVEKRADAAISLFQSAHEGMDELYNSGTSIIDDLEDAVDGFLDEEEFGKTIPFILQAWFTLVPPGSAAPLVSPEEVRETYLRAVKEIACGIDVASPEKAEQVFKRDPQPALRMALSSQALIAMRETPGAPCFPAETQLVTLAIIFTIIDLLDAKLR